MQLLFKIQVACMVFGTFLYGAGINNKNTDTDTDTVVLEVRERKWWQNNLEVGNALSIMPCSYNMLLKATVWWTGKWHLACMLEERNLCTASAIASIDPPYFAHTLRVFAQYP